MDGATPIVVIDTDDILISLQKATRKNLEAAQEQQKSSEVKPSHQRNACMNGSV